MLHLTHKLRAFKDSHPTSRKLFVVGCGRSGTHWLGYVLKSHPQIAVTVEKPAIFRPVTQMALDPSLKPRLLGSLVLRYRLEHARVSPRFYADKSHPNIWLIEELAGTFPRALFLGIQRNPYGTVASMLRHEQVRAWCENWRDFPVPNRFLGITDENIDEYAKLSLAGRCALRWVAHRDRMQEVGALLGKRFLLLQYETLILNPSQEAAQVQEFLGLESPFPEPEVRRESLDKWRRDLSSREIEEILRVTGVSAGA